MNIIISGSQYERRLISQRTKDALAAKRARGERLGATPALPVEITRRIIAERKARRTFQAIADGLIADGCQLPEGRLDGIRRRYGRWSPATMRPPLGDRLGAGLYVVVVGSGRVQHNGSPKCQRSPSERRGAMVLAMDGSNKYRLLPDVTFDTALSWISFRAGVINDPHRPEEV